MHEESSPQDRHVTEARSLLPKAESINLQKVKVFTSEVKTRQGIVQYFNLLLKQ